MDAGAAVEAEGARAGDVGAIGVQVTEIGDRAGITKGQNAGLTGRHLDRLHGPDQRFGDGFGHAQHMGEILVTHADRLVTAAGAGDFADVEKTFGGFDLQGETGVPRGEAALGLQFGDDFLQEHNMVGGLNLGNNNPVDVGADRRLQIGDRHAPGPIDADQHIGASLADTGRDRWYEGTGARLFGRRDSVLQVDFDGVGAAQMGLGDETLTGCRHEQAGTPERQHLGYGHHITPSFCRLAKSSGPRPISA